MQTGDQIAEWLVRWEERRTAALTAEKRKEYQRGTVEDEILEGNKLAREKVYLDKGEKVPADGTHTRCRTLTCGKAARSSMRSWCRLACVWRNSSTTGSSEPARVRAPHDHAFSAVTLPAGTSTGS
jgi:hypothetical protein